MPKTNVVIIGSGKVGMDLLLKVQQSDFLNCLTMIGRDPASKNLQEARRLGVCISSQSTRALENLKDDYDILFDATNAQSHIQNIPLFERLGKYVVNLTPSRSGRACIPCLNASRCLNVPEINMVTCGGQSVVPMAQAIASVCESVEYIEAVATIASLSAGQGTRENIDEYIETTELALREFTGASRVKAILVISSASPPISMRNTLYVRTKSCRLEKVKKAVKARELEIRKYVPGYRVIVPPTRIDGVITLTVQVEAGRDGFLPEYAGNLEIITRSSIRMAEFYAECHGGAG